jgi:hypothetical protein
MEGEGFFVTGCAPSGTSPLGGACLRKFLEEFIGRSAIAAFIYASVEKPPQAS